VRVANLGSILEDFFTAVRLISEAKGISSTGGITKQKVDYKL
jgi:hypothetical protein